MRENEELKSKNQSLEEQLKTALDPCSINTVQPDDKRVEPYVLEEWTNKLRAATDVCDKVQKDMDKVKEVCSLHPLGLCRFMCYSKWSLETKMYCCAGRCS